MYFMVRFASQILYITRLSVQVTRPAFLINSSMFIEINGKVSVLLFMKT